MKIRIVTTALLIMLFAISAINAHAQYRGGHNGGGWHNGGGGRHFAPARCAPERHVNTSWRRPAAVVTVGTGGFYTAGYYRAPYYNNRRRYYRQDVEYVEQPRVIVEERVIEKHVFCQHREQGFTDDHAFTNYSR